MQRSSSNSEAFASEFLEHLKKCFLASFNAYCQSPTYKGLTKVCPPIMPERMPKGLFSNRYSTDNFSRTAYMLRFTENYCKKFLRNFKEILNIEKIFKRFL